MFGRQLLRADPPLGGRRGRGKVDVGHVGVDDLLRLEHRGEPLEALVRDLDHAHVELEAAVAARLGVASRERVEDGGLATPGKPHDRDLHLVMLPVTAALPTTARRWVQYPASGSTTLTSGWAPAKRRRLSQNRSTDRSSTRVDDHDVCGVRMTFGRSYSGEVGDSGSSRNVSRIAPPIRPWRTARASAGSSTSSPRATLITHAPGFIWAIDASPIRPTVSAVRGAASTTKSDSASSSPSRSGGRTRSSITDPRNGSSPAPSAASDPASGRRRVAMTRQPNAVARAPTAR